MARSKDPWRGRSIAVEGPSGVGKSRLAAALARTLGAVRIDEAYDRLGRPPELEFEGAASLGAIESRLLDEEVDRSREMAELRAQEASAVLDTATLGPLTYTAALIHLDPRLAPAGPPLFARALALARSGALALPDAVVFLDLPRPKVAQRAASDPVGHPSGPSARHGRVAPLERRAWLEVIGPIAPDRVFRLPARASVHVLARQVRALGPVLAPGPVARATVSRAIRAVRAENEDRPRPGRRSRGKG